VGGYFDDDGNEHGFLLRHDTLTTIDVPFAGSLGTPTQWAQRLWNYCRSMGGQRFHRARVHIPERQLCSPRLSGRP
jgi:hypothetical protein